MLYCETCKELLDAPCPQRGHQTREPKSNDPVLLMRGDPIRAGMMEEIIRQADIPVLKEGLLGAGMTMWTGGMLEEHSLFVPFAAYERAKELIELPPIAEESPDDDGPAEGDQLKDQ